MGKSIRNQVLNELLKDVKNIFSVGSSGILIDDQLYEDYEVSDLEDILDVLNSNREKYFLTYRWQDGSESYKPEYGDMQDEWNIDILNSTDKYYEFDSGGRINNESAQPFDYTDHLSMKFKNISDAIDYLNGNIDLDEFGVYMHLWEMQGGEGISRILFFMAPFDPEYNLYTYGKDYIFTEKGVECINPQAKMDYELFLKYW